MHQDAEAYTTSLSPRRGKQYSFHCPSFYITRIYPIMYPDPAMDSSLFTIYCKSQCIYCKKVKKLLQEHSFPFIEIQCDVFLVENKPAFLKHMHDLAGVPVKTFPMVFHQGMFIGGYEDTQEYLHNITHR
jgi:glutaredoxin